MFTQIKMVTCKRALLCQVSADRQRLCVCLLQYAERILKGLPLQFNARNTSALRERLAKRLLDESGIFSVAFPKNHNVI
jgi:hypothetical protein